MALETSHTVGAILSVFHNGADLVQQIIKRNKKKKSELAMKQKWLLETLESAEMLIAQRNTQLLQELGVRFRIGDNIATQKLQNVSVLMQSDLIRSLQIAMKVDNAVLDLAKLQEDTTFFRRDILTTLDDLKYRLVQQAPPVAPAIPSPHILPGLERISNPDSTSPVSQSPQTSPYSSGIPLSVSIPNPATPEEPNRRMARFFSMKRQIPERSSSSASSARSQGIASPEPYWLGPVPPSEPLSGFELPAEDVQRPPTQTSAYNRIDVKVPEPNTALLHPALQSQQTSISRMPSTSTQASHDSDSKTSRESTQSQTSTFSDEKIPVVQEEEESSQLNISALAAALPPMTPTVTQSSGCGSGHRHRWSASSTTSHYGSAFMSPNTSVFSASLATSPTNTNSQSFSNANSWSLFPMPNGGHLSVTSSKPQHLSTSTNTTNSSDRERSFTSTSATPSTATKAQVDDDSNIRPTTSATTATSIGIPSMGPTPPLPAMPLLGRPSKSNNYWGFCKGSWTIRENWRKGLHQQVVMDGYYKQAEMWQCAQCHFQGGIYGSKKPYNVDPNIHVDAATNIRYRWIFLAKSHTKLRLLAKAGEGGYGCLFCSLGNLTSAVYATTEMLFQHISDEHAPVMTEDLAARAKCIAGRQAKSTEDFDINIL